MKIIGEAGFDERERERERESLLEGDRKSTQGANVFVLSAIVRDKGMQGVINIIIC
jgi:hypothetical protein